MGIIDPHPSSMKTQGDMNENSTGPRPSGVFHPESNANSLGTGVEKEEPSETSFPDGTGLKFTSII